MRYDKISKMDSYVRHGFFSRTSRQDGVVRVNCMDCLDRTNVVQSHFAKVELLRQCKYLGISIPGYFWNVFQNSIKKFNLVWADHADALSLQYAGTPALKTDFTRLGKRTAYGVLNDLKTSIVRYVINHYQDGHRQDVFDCYHGSLLEVPSREIGDVRWLLFVLYVMVVCCSMLLVFDQLTRNSMLTLQLLALACLATMYLLFTRQSKHIVSVPTL